MSRTKILTSSIAEFRAEDEKILVELKGIRHAFWITRVFRKIETVQILSASEYIGPKENIKL